MKDHNTAFIEKTQCNLAVILHNLRQMQPPPFSGYINFGVKCLTSRSQEFLNENGWLFVGVIEYN